MMSSQLHIRLENREVCRLLGLKPIQLIRWSEAGVVVANIQEAGGKGRRRVYDLDSLFEAVLAKTFIMGFKIPLATVRGLMDRLRKLKEERSASSYLEGLSQGAGVLLFLSGREESVLELRFAKLDELPGEIQSGMFDTVDSELSIPFGRLEDLKRVRRGDPILSGHFIHLLNIKSLLEDLTTALKGPTHNPDSDRKAASKFRTGQLTRRAFNDRVRLEFQRFSHQMAKRRDQLFQGRQAVSEKEAEKFIEWAKSLNE